MRQQNDNIIDPEDKENIELMVATTLAPLVSDLTFLKVTQVYDSRRDGRKFLGLVLEFGTPREGPRVWYIVDPEWDHIRCDSLAAVYKVFAKTHNVIVTDKFQVIKNWPRQDHNALVILNHLVSREEAEAA